jgi:hypothetical protein
VVPISVVLVSKVNIGSSTGVGGSARDDGGGVSCNNLVTRWRHYILLVFGEGDRRYFPNWVATVIVVNYQVADAVVVTVVVAPAIDVALSYHTRRMWRHQDLVRLRRK